MKPAENINRYSSTLASLIEQRELSRTLQYGKGINKKRAEERLSEFYEATPEEIGMIKKFGLIDPDMANWKLIENPTQRIRTERAYRSMRQKFNFMAHARTHGVSMDIFLPEWASKPGIKPLLLFKRMAYLATGNTGRGLNQAMKDRAYHKVFGYLGFGLLGGATRMAIMYNFLGAPMPQENSSVWRYILTLAWLNEMGGIISEFLFNPHGSFNRMEQARDTVTPFVLDNLWNGIRLLEMTIPTNFATGDKEMKLLGSDGALQTYGKRTVGLYAEVIKGIDKKDNKYYLKDKQASQWYNDWLKSENEGRTAQFGRTEQSMHFKNLRTAFLKGTKEEFAKIYSTLIYHMYQERIEDYKDEIQAWKSVKSQMDIYLKSLSPVRASSESNDFTIARETRFMLSLTGKNKEWLENFRESFKYRIYDYMQFTNDYWEKNEMRDLHKNFNFKRRDIYELLK